MKIVLRCFTSATLMLFLALPAIVCADEAESFDKDAEYAEDAPPMIPHHIKDTSDGTYCLTCHKNGTNNAPLCPHSVRLSCTGCHAQGEIKVNKPSKKGSRKK